MSTLPEVVFLPVLLASTPTVTPVGGLSVDTIKSEYVKPKQLNVWPMTLLMFVPRHGVTAALAIEAPTTRVSATKNISLFIFYLLRNLYSYITYGVSGFFSGKAGII